MPDGPPRKGCQHGMGFDEPCRDCDIVWHRHLLDIHRRQVNHHTAMLAELGIPPLGRF